MSLSRWKDNPFAFPKRDPELQEQQEWLKKRAIAVDVYRSTGDTTLAEDIGAFPEQPRQMWMYNGYIFHVVRTSEESAYVGLLCNHGYHDIVIIGLTEHIPHELLVGRPVSGSAKYEVASLAEGLERAADMLILECSEEMDKRIVRQLDEFFDS